MVSSPGSFQASVEPEAEVPIPKPRTALPAVVPIRTGVEPSVNQTADAPYPMPSSPRSSRFSCGPVMNTTPSSVASR